MKSWAGILWGKEDFRLVQIGYACKAGLVGGYSAMDSRIRGNDEGWMGAPLQRDGGGAGSSAMDSRIRGNDEGWRGGPCVSAPNAPAYCRSEIPTPKSC